MLALLSILSPTQIAPSYMYWEGPVRLDLPSSHMMMSPGRLLLFVKAGMLPVSGQVPSVWPGTALGKPLT